MELIVFADRLLSLPGRRRVYLLVPIVVKRSRDPFDDAFFNRLADVLSSTDDALPGQPVAYAPLHFAEIGRALSAVADEFDHGSRTLTYANTRGMPSSGRFGKPAFQQLTIASIDREIDALVLVQRELEFRSAKVTHAEPHPAKNFVASMPRRFIALAPKPE